MFHSMMRVLRYHQFNYERTNYNYAPTLPASQCGELLKLKEGKNCSLTDSVIMASLAMQPDGCNPVNSATVRLQGEF
ncbi:hypothetical protein LTSEUGA_2930 [Salmonella enterica subsp. enterica serovar Uganda str. R8-3404]|uniref:Uncharacterized protein n=1 Tax=Salmonella enterica subsp. enterica serovar Uganda str. R8-3404 TaxID=913083 RepID=A0A6C8H0V5_SALET|nr:hypothetical protein LTSEUGA_2930 [Salmonella enterica subsp. enterica serovar Uganda str. R8-3404]